MNVPVIVENKPDVLAWIDAKRSCLVDPERGAANLLFADAIIPSKCWTKIADPVPSFVTFNTNTWFALASADSPPATGEQRIILNVVWDDDRSELVDLAYVVEAEYPVGDSE